MKMNNNQDFNLFIGGQIGVFKGVSLRPTQEECIVKSLQNIPSLETGCEITAMSWGGPDETDVLVGLAKQFVKIYDTEYKAFTRNIDVSFGEGKIRGLSRYNESLLTGVESGHIKVWKFDEKEAIVLDTGSPMERMRHSLVNPTIIATGGRENDLKLWDLNLHQAIFTSKNVRPNELQVRQPVWVSDMAFLPLSSKVAVSTRYGNVRLYDPATPQRRPVVDVLIPGQALITIGLASRENHVVVGCSVGGICLVDLRQPGRLLNTYKGFTGSVRAVVCHPTEPYIVSVGLDRFLRVHHLDSKQMLIKKYLKTRQNCILLRSDFSFTQMFAKEEEVVVLNPENDYDDLFSSMEKVEESAPLQKRTRIEIPKQAATDDIQIVEEISPS